MGSTLNAWGWNDDPRTNLGLYSTRDTMLGKYSYPRVDIYSFYLSLHAMFCVAGELRQEKQTVIDEYRKDRWNYWLKDHIITQSDGTWIADRRDPNPFICQSRDKEEDKEWCWSVNAESFSNVLLSARENCQFLTIWGSWNVSEGYGKTEDIHIRSALVTSAVSLSLLRALQTCICPSKYRIPLAKDELEVKEKDYQMKGLVCRGYKEHGLDGLDPLSGKISYPPYVPRPTVSRIMKLNKSEDDRYWWRKEDGSLVMQSELWGEWNQDDYTRSFNNGCRLTGELNFILDMLERLKRDLIFEVQINRYDKYNDKYSLLPPYTKLFILKSNGFLHELRRCYQLGESTGKRVRP